MAAQTKKPDKPAKPRRKPTRKTMRKPAGNTLAASILTLTTTTPATPAEIAESINTSIQHVHQTLQRYGIEPNTTESYKKHRADILAGVQERILHSIDEEAIKSMPVFRRVMSYGILYDKERLERGQSTANIATRSVRDLSPEARGRLDQALAAMYDSPESTPPAAQNGGHRAEGVDNPSE